MRIHIILGTNSYYTFKRCINFGIAIANRLSVRNAVTVFNLNSQSSGLSDVDFEDFIYIENNKFKTEIELIKRLVESQPELLLFVGELTKNVKMFAFCQRYGVPFEIIPVNKSREIFFKNQIRSKRIKSNYYDLWRYELLRTLSCEVELSLNHVKQKLSSAERGLIEKLSIQKNSNSKEASSKSLEHIFFEKRDEVVGEITEPFHKVWENFQCFVNQSPLMNDSKKVNFEERWLSEIYVVQ